MQHIRLIVGLGNPGSQYESTRHNIGFEFIDRLVTSTNGAIALQTKFHSHLGQVTLGLQNIKIAKPTTFMNLSGQSVLAICQFHKIELDQILVVHDELDLEPGIVRLKTGGGHGGHNGLRNIIERFGGQKDFHRLRIGIGHPGHRSKVHSHVLTKASPDDQISMTAAINAAIKLAPGIVKGEFQKVMQELHQKDFGPTPPTST